jgi:hypothetical protein
MMKVEPHCGLLFKLNCKEHAMKVRLKDGLLVLTAEQDNEMQDVSDRYV